MDYISEPKVFLLKYDPIFGVQFSDIAMVPMDILDYESMGKSMNANYPITSEKNIDNQHKNLH